MSNYPQYNFSFSAAGLGTNAAVFFINNAGTSSTHPQNQVSHIGGTASDNSVNSGAYAFIYGVGFGLASPGSQGVPNDNLLNYKGNNLGFADNAVVDQYGIAFVTWPNAPSSTPGNAYDIFYDASQHQYDIGVIYNYVFADNVSQPVTHIEPLTSFIVDGVQEIAGAPPPITGSISFQNTDGQAAIWNLNGTTVSGGATISPNPGSSWTEIGTGDFYNNGSSDLLWQNANGQAAIWEMNGTSLVGGGTVGADPGPSWKVIGSGDFNHDGFSDILWQNAGGQVAIWELNGTNIVGGGSVANPGPDWKAIGTGDFNHDGNSDILLQNSGGQVAIWEMNGSNIIGGGVIANPGPNWKVIGTGDFNGDNHSDILLQNTSGQVAIWEMNGSNIIGGGVVNANPGPSWTAIGTNGGSDILFQSTGGQTAIWDMSGTNIVGGGTVSQNAGPGWKAIGLS
jgi:FG-GAP-like repeat